MVKPEKETAATSLTKKAIIVINGTMKFARFRALTSESTTLSSESLDHSSCWLAIGESLLTSLFTFLIISIRLT